MAGLHDSVVGLTESFQALSLPCLDPKTADVDVGRDTGGLTFRGAYQCGLRGFAESYELEAGSYGDRDEDFHCGHWLEVR